MNTRLQTLLTKVIKRPGRLERLGSSNCSWTIPTSYLNETSICYCLGCGEDVSFDAALAARFNCNVWSYDPTPRATTHMAALQENVLLGKTMYIPATQERYELTAKALENWHFEPIGVWSSNETLRFYAPTDETHVSHSIVNLQKTDSYFEAECRTISKLMQQNGHSQIDLMKIDIEGAEYEVITNLRESGIKPKILCVEFDEGHTPLDTDAPRRIRAAVREIRAMGYMLAHRENSDYTFVL